MYTIKHLVFGYDLENIERVEKYVRSNFKEDRDYVMFVGMGDDVMNSLDVSERLSNDDVFMSLVDQCEGGGEWID